jgi:hypothetical protein
MKSKCDEEGTRFEHENRTADAQAVPHQIESLEFSGLQ